MNTNDVTTVETVALAGGNWAAILAQATLDAERMYPIEGCTLEVQGDLATPEASTVRPGSR